MPVTPATQRTTRSGSNTPNINLNDIKALIEKSREEILTSVQVETEKYGKIVQAISTRLDEVMKANEALMQRVNFLESRVDYLSNRKNDPVLCEDTLREMQERHKRRKFIVISGLQECCSGSPEDRSLEDEEMVKTLASEIGIENLEVKDISRIGSLQSRRPRLLRFKCSSVSTKLSLLRTSKNLRRCKGYERVYLNPDLTKLQQEQNRKLRHELEVRREAGERVVIRAGRIVEVKRGNHFDRGSNFL